ncbi:carbohydrate sulfotransferase 5-like isoform X1 [Neodiprion fabricii]|uniref:carbohydrate sulfotransferase 5-like isoform X1 n=1 Tax=Neodiprion fabricii TaxID=2872261 RepID=UPI001ED8E7D0|nr:carbohydrate sulfotransferase 5-like isoform X1 [Neodiprion fabricii]XP_046426412.1 carbohydrate sulfotransferase 5-like isoform X1 [Neodiprion fabricii]
MSKRASSYGLIGVGIFFTLYSTFNVNYEGHSVRKTEPTVPIPQQSEQKSPRWEDKPQITTVGRGIDPVSKTIEQIMSEQPELISNAMEDYQYPNGKYNISASKLEDLVMEQNGRPVRSLIVTTWRSGSTFLGDILNAHPANYYHYEPLLAFDIVQVRGPPLAAKALKWVKDLLNCEYQDLDEYIDYGKPHPWVFNHNTNLWKQCRHHKEVCYDHKFLSSMCKLFPFQSMKLVRMRLRIAQELLADEKLAVRMVLLVRDPRGILQSRKHRDFCPPSPDCSDPALTCADLVSDYKVAVELLKKYPTRFKVIRYEDLSLDPYKYVEELYKFYGLFFHPETKKFLDTHTKASKGGVSSTFRDSAAAPFHWKKELEFGEVEEIQESCATAMKCWGYVPAMNATHQEEFNPVTSYVLEL